MVRRQKDVNWEAILPWQDLVYVWQKIEPDRWYPMATFERLGVAILDHLDGATMDAVRFWGRFSADRGFAANIRTSSFLDIPSSR